MSQPSKCSRRYAGFLLACGSALSSAQPVPQPAVLDTLDPVLTEVVVAPTYNVARTTPPFSILLKGSDDLSGIRTLLLTALGPSGQRVPSLVELDYPATVLNRRIGLGWGLYNGRLLEPGTWVLESARVVDLAGNPAKYNQAALAALGSTPFTVVNGGVYDAVAPTLTSGKILTPSISLSGPAVGTSDQAPFAGVKLTVVDTGSTTVAGVASAAVAFCLADESRCLDLLALPNATNSSTVTLTAGQQVSGALGQVPGDYLLYEVVLIDQAGNMRELLSTQFGGTTDFSLLFPSTRIRLLP